MTWTEVAKYTEEIYLQLYRERIEMREILDKLILKEVGKDVET